MTPPGRLWLRRIFWLVAIWAMSVAALGLVAFAMRALMAAARLHA